MNKYLIIALVFLVAALVFALQNTAQIDVKFLWMNAHTSQALVIILSFIFGTLVVLGIYLPKIYKRNSENAKLKKHVEEADKVIKDLRGNKEENK